MANSLKGTHTRNQNYYEMKIPTQRPQAQAQANDIPLFHTTPPDQKATTDYLTKHSGVLGRIARYTGIALRTVTGLPVLLHAVLIATSPVSRYSRDTEIKQNSGEAAHVISKEIETPPPLPNRNETKLIPITTAITNDETEIDNIKQRYKPQAESNDFSIEATKSEGSNNITVKFIARIYKGARFDVIRIHNSTFTPLETKFKELKNDTYSHDKQPKPYEINTEQKYTYYLVPHNELSPTSPPENHPSLFSSNDDQTKLQLIKTLAINANQYYTQECRNKFKWITKIPKQQIQNDKSINQQNSNSKQLLTDDVMKTKTHVELHNQAEEFKNKKDYTNAANIYRFLVDFYQNANNLNFAATYMIKSVDMYIKHNPNNKDAMIAILKNFQETTLKQNPFLQNQIKVAIDNFRKPILNISHNDSFEEEIKEEIIKQ